MNVPPKKITIKNCLFGAPNILKITDQSKWVHSGFGIAFDETVKWNLVVFCQKC